MRLPDNKFLAFEEKETRMDLMSPTDEFYAYKLTMLKSQIAFTFKFLTLVCPSVPNIS